MAEGITGYNAEAEEQSDDVEVNADKESGFKPTTESSGGAMSELAKTSRRNKALAILAMAISSVFPARSGAEESAPVTQSSVSSGENESREKIEARDVIRRISQDIAKELLGRADVVAAEKLDEAFQLAHNPEINALAEETDQEILIQFLLTLNTIIKESGIEGEYKNEYTNSLYGFGVGTIEAALGIKLEDSLEEQAPPNLSSDSTKGSLFSELNEKTVNDVLNFSSEMLQKPDKNVDRSILETAEIARGDGNRPEILKASREIAVAALESVGAIVVAKSAPGEFFQGPSE